MSLASRLHVALYYMVAYNSILTVLVFIYIRLNNIIIELLINEIHTNHSLLRLYILKGTDNSYLHTIHFTSSIGEDDATKV